MNIYLKDNYKVGERNFNISDTVNHGLEIIFEEMLKHLSCQKLSDILDIYIPQDYMEEISEFQKENGMNIENTNEEGHRAFGRMMKCNNRYVIFYDINIILPILLEYQIDNDKISDETEFLLSIVEHELIHAVDDYLNKNIYKTYERSESSKDYNKMFINEAYNDFKEYIAFRAGHFNNTKCTFDDIETFCNEVQVIEEEFKKIRDDYKYNNNLNFVVININKKILYLLLRLSHILGKINSKEENKDGLNKILSECCGNITYFTNKMSECVEKIYCKYPNLNEDDFVDLKNIIIEYVESFGIYFENVEEGIYISIPFDYKN